VAINEVITEDGSVNLLTADCTDERIVKIGQYWTQLRQKKLGSRA